jgi:PKD repeat protein
MIITPSQDPIEEACFVARTIEMNGSVIKSIILSIMLFGVGAMAGTVHISDAASNVVITLDPSISYQTISGWEATSQSGQEFPEFDNYKDTLFNLAVNDLGINRIRLEIRAGSENSKDYWSQWRNGQIDEAEWRCLRYSTINDNGDPDRISGSGFQFSELDDKVTKNVTPLKQRLEARGEKLFINLEYVAFTKQINGTGCPSNLQYIHDDPDEYAEMILATSLHLRSKFGIEPDTWEVILEPDNVSEWNGNLIGRAIVATAAKLEQNGFDPQFIAPSTKSMARAHSYFDAIAKVPGAVSHMRTLSYHRYSGVSSSDLQAIVNRANQYGLDTSMLEKIKADYVTLHDDLKNGRNSAWQQFSLAFPGTGDSGGAYYQIDLSNPSNPNINMGSRTKFLRQYFKFIRAGAQRIEATSSNSVFDPLAFINTDGRYVVVVKADSGGDFSIEGLPSGRYGIKYTTSGQYDIDHPDMTLSSGGTLTTSIPASGVITVYAKTVGAEAAPTATATPRPTATATPRPTATSTPRPTVTPVPPTATPTAVAPTATPVPGGSASSLMIEGGQASPGDTISVDVVLDAAPFGVAGYDIEIEVANPALAKITEVRFDSSFPLTDDILASDGSSARIIAADLGDPGSVRSIRLDDDNGSLISHHTASGDIQVLNVAPAVNAGADAVADEGNTFTRTGGFSDPGGTSWNGSVDYGDGSGLEALALSDSSFTLSHVYSRQGVYTVTVTITDDSSALGSASFQVEVVHVFPTMPGMDAPAKDLDGDGMAEDINGNGRLDFDDIVRFFKNINSQEVQGHVQDFDFNGNGFIDMDDIVKLFTMLISNFSGDVESFP